MLTIQHNHQSLNTILKYSRTNKHHAKCSPGQNGVSHKYGTGNWPLIHTLLFQNRKLRVSFNYRWNADWVCRSHLQKSCFKGWQPLLVIQRLIEDNQYHFSTRKQQKLSSNAFIRTEAMRHNLLLENMLLKSLKQKEKLNSSLFLW